MSVPELAGTGDVARLRLLHELGCAFAARTDLDDLVPLVIEKCREVLDAEGAAVLLRDPETDEFYFPYLAQERSEMAERLSAIRFPADQGIAGAVAKSGRGLRLDDVTRHPAFYNRVDETTGGTTRCMVAAPLVTRDGTIGVIQAVNRRDGGTFDDGDLAFLESLAGSIAIAIENAQLYGRMRKAEEELRDEVGALRRDIARIDGFDEIIGNGTAMREVYRLMESAASSPIAVLIEGETGTGKELVARGIHRAGPRASAPFLAVNCAALPETLLESELFGHKRGAFTGATHDRRGHFETAAGGTVFLDEIGDMPPSMQARLLRVLQEGEVIPLGDSRPRRVDVRILSATNRDLAAAVREGRFRDDLYFRLAAFPIRLPPLRDRREDLPLLIDHFLRQATARVSRSIGGVSGEAVERLTEYDWPGNVRELQNEIERAVTLGTDGENVGLGHLSAKVTATDAGAVPIAAIVPSGPPVPLREARARFEEAYIRDVLARENGNVSRTAGVLGLSRVMLHKKLRAYGIR